MMKNMTEGKPYKLILAFMIPVLFGGLFQNFYNIVDSMIVGRYIGVEALASVGSTTYLIFFVNGWIMGMTSGFAIMISQRYGAKDEKGLKHYVAMSVWLCVIMSVVLTIVLLIFNEKLLRLVNTPADIFGMTKGYVTIMFAGIPVTIVYNMLSAIARALGDSKTPLYFLIISSVLNVVLDLLFVAVLHIGVEGAALATVLAQCVAAVLCMEKIRDHPFSEGTQSLERTKRLETDADGCAYGTAVFNHGHWRADRAVILEHVGSNVYCCIFCGK